MSNGEHLAGIDETMRCISSTVTRVKSVRNGPV